MSIWPRILGGTVSALLALTACQQTSSLVQEEPIRLSVERDPRVLNGEWRGSFKEMRQFRALLPSEELDRIFVLAERSGSWQDGSYEILSFRRSDGVLLLRRPLGAGFSPQGTVALREDRWLIVVGKEQTLLLDPETLETSQTLPFTGTISSDGKVLLTLDHGPLGNGSSGERAVRRDSLSGAVISVVGLPAEHLGSPYRPFWSNDRKDWALAKTSLIQLETGESLELQRQHAYACPLPPPPMTDPWAVKDITWPQDLLVTDTEVWLAYSDGFVEVWDRQGKNRREQRVVEDCELQLSFDETHEIPHLVVQQKNATTFFSVRPQGGLQESTVYPYGTVRASRGADGKVAAIDPESRVLSLFTKHTREWSAVASPEQTVRLNARARYVSERSYGLEGTVDLDGVRYTLKGTGNSYHNLVFAHSVQTTPEPYTNWHVELLLDGKPVGEMRAMRQVPRQTPEDRGRFSGFLTLEKEGVSVLHQYEIERALP